MFITKRNALTIKLVLRTTRKTEEALIDSGATENFLDPRTVTKLRLITEDLDCEELTTSSFRGQTREAQGSVKRNRRGRRGGARRIYPQEYKRRRGRGCRSDWVNLDLKGVTKEMDEVRGEDEGDDYQGGVDDDEDSKSKGIQVGSWLGRMHKWAV